MAPSTGIARSVASRGGGLVATREQEPLVEGSGVLDRTGRPTKTAVTMCLPDVDFGDHVTPPPVTVNVGSPRATRRSRP